MSYLFRQKLKISELAPVAKCPKKILLVEGESFRRQIYSLHLRRESFEVKPCGDLEFMAVLLDEHKPDLLVLSTEIFPYLKHMLGLLKRLTKAFPDTPIVTVGYNTDADSLKQLMSLGISSHLDRRLSRPQDLAHIVKIILNN